LDQIELVGISGQFNLREIIQLEDEAHAGKAGFVVGDTPTPGQLLPENSFHF
jgi:hypothetical protein